MKAHFFRQLGWLWICLFAAPLAYAQTLSIKPTWTDRDVCYHPSVPYSLTVGGYGHGTLNGTSLDMVILMDMSGSLGSTDPDKLRFTALRKVIDSIPSNSDIKVALIWWDDTTVTGFSLSDVATAKAKLPDEITKHSEPGGTTAMGGAIAAAINEFKTNGRPSSNKTIVIFTDGDLENQGTDPEGKATLAASYGYTVNVVQLLNFVQQNANVAANGRGSYFYDPDPNKLAAAMTDPNLVGLKSITLTNKTTSEVMALDSGFGAFGLPTQLTFQAGVSPASTTYEVAMTTSAGIVKTASFTVRCTGNGAKPFSFVSTELAAGSRAVANNVLTVDPEETGTTGYIWVAAIAPNGSMRFLTPAGWVNYTSGAYPAYLIGRLGYHVLWFFDGKTDTSSFAGSNIYVGYGTSQDDMLSRFKFGHVYTVR